MRAAISIIAVIVVSGTIATVVITIITVTILIASSLGHDVVATKGEVIHKPLGFGRERCDSDKESEQQQQITLLVELHLQVSN